MSAKSNPAPSALHEVELYTDGACSGNPGPGGWAAIVIPGEGGDPVELSGGERRTTNNRMELTAALEGLRSLPEHSRVVVVTDSQVRTVLGSLPGETLQAVSDDGDTVLLVPDAHGPARAHLLHSLEGRLCRWLLQSEDLIESNQIALTQEFLSYMLGVRRPTVSVAASELQKDGLIQYRRGIISVVDRAELLKRSCQCYEVLCDEIRAQRG